MYQNKEIIQKDIGDAEYDNWYINDKVDWIEKKGVMLNMGNFLTSNGKNKI
jgi:hypothetical protein